MAIEQYVAFAQLNADSGNPEQVCVAVSAANQDQLQAWLSGEVHARGITPAWTPMLRWLVTRTSLTYRDPVAPPASPPSPTTGQLWPR